MAVPVGVAGSSVPVAVGVAEGRVPDAVADGVNDGIGLTDGCEDGVGEGVGLAGEGEPKAVGLAIGEGDGVVVDAWTAVSVGCVVADGVGVGCGDSIRWAARKTKSAAEIRPSSLASAPLQSVP